MVNLLDETHLRIGNSTYAEVNGSYGLTTLQDDHTVVSGNNVTFHFPGKSGKNQEFTLEDRRLAHLVQRCLELPGQHLFQYIGEEEELQAITAIDVNNYIQTHMGKDFIAKEFRTWGATVAAASKLAALNAPESAQMAKKNLMTAVKHAAQVLGNTPVICRQYYIHPVIAEAYASGELARVVKEVRRGKIKCEEELSEIETAVLVLLP